MHEASVCITASATKLQCMHGQPRLHPHLHIYGVDCACGANQLGQKQRVMAVASCGIHHSVAWLNYLQLQARVVPSCVASLASIVWSVNGTATYRGMPAGTCSIETSSRPLQDASISGWACSMVTTSILLLHLHVAVLQTQKQ